MSDQLKAIEAQLAELHSQYKTAEAERDRAGAAYKDLIDRAQSDLDEFRSQRAEAMAPHDATMDQAKARMADLLDKYIGLGGKKTVKVGDDGHVQQRAGRAYFARNRSDDDLFALWWSNPLKYAVLAQHMTVTFDLKALWKRRKELPYVATYGSYFWEERGDPIIAVK